jgi:hypothetical protein
MHNSRIEIENYLGDFIRLKSRIITKTIFVCLNRNRPLAYTLKENDDDDDDDDDDNICSN